MGLDIYFFARDKRSGETRVTDDSRLPGDKVGYFRKVNALLHWVNTHVAKVENCEEIPLARAHLEQLFSTLSTLTRENCRQCFPTTSGFFFGSTDYDQWYWSDVADVRLWASELLDGFDFDRKELLFWAWW